MSVAKTTGSFYSKSGQLTAASGGFYQPRTRKFVKEHLKNDLEFYNETLLLNFLWKIAPLSYSGGADEAFVPKKVTRKHVCLKSNTIHQKIKTIISIFFQSTSDADLTSTPATAYSSNLSPTLIRGICRRFSIINKKQQQQNQDSFLFVYDCACDKDHLSLFMLFQEARAHIANLLLPLYKLFTSERLISLSCSDVSFFIEKDVADSDEAGISLVLMSKSGKKRSSTHAQRNSLVMNKIVDLKWNEIELKRMSCLTLNTSCVNVVSDKCSNPRIIVNANRVVYELPVANHISKKSQMNTHY
jgi:hypothetical protein